MPRTPSRLCVVALVALACSCTSKVEGQTGRKYPCDRTGAGASCPAGWSCGLEGFCKDPAQPSPYLCESDRDCVSTAGNDFHCGFPDGFNNPKRCYDRLKATVTTCRHDAGSSDCAPGWRCGLEEVCHPLDAGAPYLCSQDSDCESGFRCASGRCADVTAYALRPSDATLSFEQIHPQLAPNGPLATSRNGEVIAWVEGTSLRLVDLTFPSDAGRLPYSDFRLPLDGGAFELFVSIYGDVVVVSDGNGVREVGRALRGLGPSRPLVTGLPNASVSVGGGDLLVAFTADRYALGTLYGAPTSSASVPGAAAGNSIRWAFAVDQGTQLGLVAYVLATQRGLYVAEASRLDGGISATPQWVPVTTAAISSQDCGGAAPRYGRVRPLASSSNDWGMMVELPDAGPAPQIAILSRPDSSRLGVCDTLPALETVCRVCPDEAELLEMWGERRQQSIYVVALCAVPNADAGRSATLYNTVVDDLSDGGCRLENNAQDIASAAKLPFRIERSEATWVSFLDARSTVFSCSSFFCLPLQITVNPVRSNGWLKDGAWTGVGPGNPVIHAPGLGLLTSRQVESLAGAVRDSPSWALVIAERPDSRSTQVALVTLPSVALRSQSVLGFLADSNDVALDLVETPGRYQAFARHLPQAGDAGLVVVGLKDRLWSGRVPENAESGGEITLEVRAVPAPFARIQAMVVERDDPSTPGALFTGYLLIQGRVFRVVAENEQLYRSELVPLPEGEVTGLWADGYRGRAAFRSGEAYSLPHGIKIADAIPEGPLPDVIGFASSCGRGFALGHAGLYQLSTRPSSPIGVWERLDLSDAGVGVGDVATGRLFENPGDVLLFTSDVRALLASTTACSEPQP